MATGTIESTFKVTSPLAPGYANERTVEPRKRKSKRMQAALEPQHPPAHESLQVGDVVICQDYFSGGEYRKLFMGTATIKHIAVEQRKSFSNGKIYPVRRMTVITPEGTRYDVLAAMLQFVSPLMVEVVSRPVPQPAPVVAPAPAPLLLMPPKIAGYLPARCGKSNYDVDAAAARAAIRAEYEAETGEKLPERTGVDVGVRKLWRRNPDGTMEKRAAGE